MRRMKTSFIAAASFALAAASVSSTFAAATGAFSSPITTNTSRTVLLSVDMNGGPITAANATTEGSTGPSATPLLLPDASGVLWSPWGGPTSTNGDGTQLPSSQSSPQVAATSINKTFGAITATVAYSSVNVTQNQYAAGVNPGSGSVQSINSRDRGTPSGAANDNDLFRDLIFAGGSGSNVQSANFIQLKFTGLLPSTSYQIAAYSYDSSGGHTTNWTATAPTQSLLIEGYFAAGTNNFVAPADEQSITWTAGTTPAPAVFTVTADGSGTASLWAFGGNGVTGTQASDSTYLNGFQVALAVPEPTSIATLGALAVGAVSRRRRA